MCVIKQYRPKSKHYMWLSLFTLQGISPHSSKYSNAQLHSWRSDTRITYPWPHKILYIAIFRLFAFYLDRTVGGQTGNHGRWERGIGPGKVLDLGLELGSPKYERTICRSTRPHGYGSDPIQYFYHDFTSLFAWFNVEALQNTSR